MTMKQITTALDDIGPMSALELHRLMGITRLATNKQIKLLRDKGLIRIERYDRQPDGTQGRAAPIYGLGSEPDAQPIRAQSTRQRNQKYNRRHAALISARRYPHVRQAAGVWAGLM